MRSRIHVMRSEGRTTVLLVPFRNSCLNGSSSGRTRAYWLPPGAASCSGTGPQWTARAEAPKT